MNALACRHALCAALLALASSAIAQTAPASSEGTGFAVHDGDRVLFYGDSITEQRLYTTDIEEYVLTRYPQWTVSFTNAGIGGDKVSGGWAGPIDLRLDRDVLPVKPTVMTVMLGMNDGYYHSAEPGIEKTYQDGYKYLVDTTLAAVPGLRLWLLGPSPYDEVTQPNTMHYNDALVAFSRFDQQEAERVHQGFADLNAPVVTALEKANTAQTDLAGSLIPDRVHPGDGVHWVMAQAVLTTWHAPALVSSVQIDAAGARAADAKNATVTELRCEKKSGALTWTAQESALPLPLPAHDTDPVTDLAIESSGLVEALDQEMLTVAGLPGGGSWQLTIDGQNAGTFSAADLAKGVNLARVPTPMLGQAQRLAWDTDHRNNLERQLYRLAVGTSQHLETAPAAKVDAIQKAVATSIAQQRKDAQPVPHHFALTPEK